MQVNLQTSQSEQPGDARASAQHHRHHQHHPKQQAGGEEAVRVRDVGPAVAEDAQDAGESEEVDAAERQLQPEETLQVQVSQPGDPGWRDQPGRGVRRDDRPGGEGRHG